MILTVMKRISFCAGHRLHEHGGKCEYLHGHNYLADFYVASHQTDAVGRVIDFAELKHRLKHWLDTHWDHGLILNQRDERGIQAARLVEPCKLYLLPENPTAENMARHLLLEICPQLLGETGVKATKVVIWETEDSFAEALLDG